MLELNTLYNESCIDTLKRFDNWQIDLVVADFPYGIELDYDGYQDTVENLKMLIENVVPELRRVAKLVYITCGVQNVQLYPQCDWIMSWYYGTTNTYGRNGFNSWQPILVYGKDPYLANGMGCRMDVIVDAKTPDKNGHPCPKPITMWKKLILRGSALKTDLVYDPFMGSGTTAIACEYIGRNWVGSEQSKIYCDIAKKRLHNFRTQGILEFKN
jgi:DNA modification methylase